MEEIPLHSASDIVKYGIDMVSDANVSLEEEKKSNHEANNKVLEMVQEYVNDIRFTKEARLEVALYYINTLEVVNERS